MGLKDFLRKLAAGGGGVTVDYSGWEDERLIDAWRGRHQLTDAARALLAAELQTRGLEPRGAGPGAAPPVDDGRADDGRADDDLPYEPAAAAEDEGDAAADAAGKDAPWETDGVADEVLRAALAGDWETVAGRAPALDETDLEELFESQVIEEEYGRVERIGALVCERDPGRGHAWFLRGAIASMTGADDDAVAHYRAAVAAERAEPRGWANLAALLAERGDLDEALATVERGLDALPGDEVIRTTHVLVLRNRGDVAAARAALARHHEAISEATRAQLEQLLDSPVEPAADRPARRWPHLATKASLAAREFVKDAVDGRPGALDVAERVFRRALALDRFHEGQFEAALDVGAALLAAGQPERAIALYDAVLETWPNAVPLRHNRGNALLLLERLEEAAAEYRRVIEVVPEWGDPRVNLVSTLTRLGRFDEATAELDVLERGGVDTDLVMALDDQLERAMEAAGVAPGDDA